ncbi:hypothetical protein Gekk315_00054 [Aeromonas phage Gekk3-15]
MLLKNKMSSGGNAFSTLMEIAVSFHGFLAFSKSAHTPRYRPDMATEDVYLIAPDWTVYECKSILLGLWNANTCSLDWKVTDAKAFAKIADTLDYGGVVNIQNSSRAIAALLAKHYDSE